jgi:hypothetical protein
VLVGVLTSRQKTAGLDKARGTQGFSGPKATRKNNHPDAVSRENTYDTGLRAATIGRLDLSHWT